MAWPWEVVERYHDIQNPTNPEKIRRLGDSLSLTSDSRVLDVACGKGGPALILAGTYGCRILGVEIRDAFAEEARARVAANGLQSLVEVQTADASELELEPEAWDAALCLGAGFVWGTIADAASALRPCVPLGGFVAIGEPFWREWPLPDSIDAEAFVDLATTVTRLEQDGLVTTAIIAASADDWDHYESLHWRAIEGWLAEHPVHPDAEDIRAQHDRSAPPTSASSAGCSAGRSSSAARSESPSPGFSRSPRYRRRSATPPGLRRRVSRPRPPAARPSARRTRAAARPGTRPAGPSHACPT
jgi:SAM-dependent methyltransferase